MATQITEGSIVVAAPEQVSCDLGGEAAILDMKTGVYYGLNPIGARIWELIAEPKRVSELRDLLLEEYDVDPDVCIREVLALLEQLSSKSLIVVTHA